MAGFRIATGYVSVEIRYDQNRLRKAAEKAGRGTGDSFSGAFSKRVERTLGRGRLFRNLGTKSGKDFASAFGSRFQKDFRSALGTKKLEKDVEKSGDALGRSLSKGMTRATVDAMRSLGKESADSFSRGFKDNATVATPGVASKSLEREGNAAGATYSRGLRRGIIEHSKGVFSGVKKESDRNHHFFSGVGRRGARLFSEGFGDTLEMGSRTMMSGFKNLMSKQIGLTVGALVAAIGAVALAMPAIGAAIAGALTIGFAGGIGVLGALAWKESDKVRNAFKTMSGHVVSDFKKISAPMESVLVALAGDIREAYDSLSPSLQSFFATVEPSFKSFQKNILQGFSEWGPAIERSGSAFSALEKHLGPMMREKIAELGTAFEEVFAAVERNPEAVTAVFRFIMNAIIGTVRAVAWLTDAWAKMRSGWESDWAGLRSILTGLGALVSGVFGGVIAGVKGVVSGIWESLSGLISGFKMIFSGDFIGGLSRIFEGIFRMVGSVLTGLVEGVVHLVAKVFEIFGVDTSRWVENTKQFFYNAWNAILGFFKGLPLTVAMIFVNLWNGVKTTFSTFLGWVVGFGSRVISVITAPFRWVYNAIVGNSIIPDLVNGIMTWLRNLLSWVAVPLNGIKNFFVTVFRGARDLVMGIIRGLVNGARTLFTNFVIGARVIFGALRGFFSGVWNGIRNVVIGAVRGFVNFSRTFFGNFVKGVRVIFGALRGFFSGVWNGIRNVVVGAVRGFVNVARGVFTGFSKFVRSVFGAVRNFFGSVWRGIRNTVVGVVRGVVNWVKGTFSSWVGWIYAKFNALKKNASNIWNGLVGRIRSIVRGVVSWVRKTFSGWVGWIYDKFNALRRNAANIWNGLIGRIRSIVRGVVNWVRKTFTSWVGWIYGKFNALRKNASNIWNALTSKIRSIVRGVVNWVRGTFVKWVSWIYDRFNRLRTNAVNIWTKFKNGIVDKVRDLKDGATRLINKFKDGFIEAFNRTKKGVERVWNKVKKVAKEPVEFMINRVYNDGIRILWSKIADHVPGLGYLDRVGIPKGFARGGILPGQSRYTQGDDQLVPMRRGEGVYVSEAMKDPYERARLHAVNKTAMRGLSLRNFQAREGFATGGIASRESVTGKRSVERTRGGDPREGYSIGGIVEGALEKAKDFASSVLGNIVGWATKPFTNAFNLLKGGDSGGTDKKIFPGVPYHAGMALWDKMKSFFQSEDDSHNSSGSNWTGAKGNLKRAVSWAKSQHGKPYQWGGNGNPSWDCSGYLSAIESVIRGQKPHRRWSTHAFGKRGPSGWQKDLDSPFMVGITHRGVGHTAGTLMGNKVESAGGGKGVRFNGGALGHDSSKFQSVYGLHNAIPLAKRLKTGSGRWRTVVEAVLKELGLPMSHVSNVLKAIQKESGGNARAKNNWDSNARAGTPSMGLLQTIKPTFDAYAGKYKKLGPFNPKANIYAAIRYAQARYGSGWSKRMARPGGYSLGGVVGGTPLGSGSHDVGGLLPDKHVAYNRSGEAEVVQTLDQLKAVVAAAEKGGDTIVLNGDVNVHCDDFRDVEDVIKVFKGLRQSGRSNGGVVKFDIRRT